MNIQISNFDENIVERNGIGAGIIPISVNEEGKYCFLLAKERYNPTWKGSNRWSGFEGGRKSFESMNDNALREYYEESLDTIRTEGGDMRDIINSKKYNIKIVINMHQEKLQSRYHTTYLVWVPWQTKCIEEFDRIRKKLLNIQLCEEILNKLYTDINIFKINSESPIGLIHAVKNIERKEENKMCTTYIVNDNNRNVEKKVVSKIDEKAIMWQYMRKCTTFILKLFDHPAVVKKYDYCGIIYNVNVGEDYLEKEKMKWWDIDKIKAILKNGGSYENEQFKSFFMPVLKCIIDNIS